MHALSRVLTQRSNVYSTHTLYLMHWGLNYCQNNRTMNTLNIFGMFIVYCQSQWRSEQASKPKLTTAGSLFFSCLIDYTDCTQKTFPKCFWCSNFVIYTVKETFASNNKLLVYFFVMCYSTQCCSLHKLYHCLSVNTVINLLSQRQLIWWRKSLLMLFKTSLGTIALLRRLF